MKRTSAWIAAATAAAIAVTVGGVQTERWDGQGRRHRFGRVPKAPA